MKTYNKKCPICGTVNHNLYLEETHGWAFLMFQKRGVVVPRKPKRPCGYSGCPKLAVDGSQYCAEHKAEENRNYNRYRRNQETEKIYKSKTWRMVRKQYYESHPLCENFLLEGKTTPAEEIHHIIPLSAGGEPYSFENLKSLCRSCHLKEHHRIGDR